MKKLICIAVFLLAVAPLGSANPILFLSPASPTINVGDPVTIDVMISGVVSPWLGSYNIVIGFNPAITPIVAVAWPDDFLGIPSTTRDADFDPVGLVTVTETSLLSPALLGTLQSGNDPFRLFEVVFGQSLASGTSSLTFEQVTLTDGNGNSLASTSTNGNITVGATPVPEPGTLILFGVSAIGGLGAQVWRKLLG